MMHDAKRQARSATAIQQRNATQRNATQRNATQRNVSAITF
jgi:hypothetical protein